MTITEMIAQLEAIKAEHGDLDILDDQTYEVTDVRLRVADEGEYPEDWNLPGGCKFVEVGSNR